MPSDIINREIMKNKNELVCYTSDKSLNETTPDEMSAIFVTEFNDSAATSFYKEFMKLNSDPRVTTIPVIVSSFGGQVHALLCMLDIIKSASKPVATVGLGKAMSCGAVLLAAGTKGLRYAAPNVDVMIHEVSSMDWGKLTELESGVKHTKKLNTKLFKLLGEYSGNKPSYFTARMKEKANVDWFLTAEECKSIGLVDAVGVPTLVKNRG